MKCIWEVQRVQREEILNEGISEGPEAGGRGLMSTSESRKIDGVQAIAYPPIEM